MGEILTFETNEFSLYALAYEDSKQETTEPGKDEEIKYEDSKQETAEPAKNEEIKNDMPQTGDTAILIFTLLATISILGLVIVNKNKKK